MEAPADRKREWAWLAGLLLLALVCRLSVMIALPNIHYGDEIYQALEQAHRVVFGYGVVPWEFRVGTRSWILPGLLAVPMWVGGQLSDDPAFLTMLAGACLVLSSLLIVIGAFVLGRRVSLTHAITAGFAAAVWFELIYHAGRSLTEVVATVPLVLALVLASAPRPGRTALAWTGLLLGLCLVLRFHLAPGLAVIVLFLVWRHGWRVVGPLAIGALVPLLAAGAIDAWTWGVPFASIVRNFGSNVIEGRAATYGVEPIYDYVLSIGARWLVGVPVLGVLIAFGARRFPMWLATAAAIIVSHSVIDHKEYRFIFPAVTCLVILAGIGSADLVNWLRRVAHPRVVRLALPACLVSWAVLSLGLSVGPWQRSAWTNERAALQAFHWVHDQPDLCGLGLSGLEWAETGGYAHLHRPVPLYTGRWQRSLPSLIDAFNYQVHRTSGVGSPSAAYSRETCFTDSQGEVCIYRRPGTCQAEESFSINALLVATGQ